MKPLCNIKIRAGSSKENRYKNSCATEFILKSGHNFVQLPVHLLLNITYPASPYRLKSIGIGILFRTLISLESLYGYSNKFIDLRKHSYIRKRIFIFCRRILLVSNVQYLMDQLYVPNSLTRDRSVLEVIVYGVSSGCLFCNGQGSKPSGY